MRLIHGASFDPETIRLLALAFERASTELARDQPIQEAAAKRIIEAAQRGERDLDTLVEHGLGRKSALPKAC